MYGQDLALTGGGITALGLSVATGALVLTIIGIALVAVAAFNLLRKPGDYRP